jgi:hypothetical protein
MRNVVMECKHNALAYQDGVRVVHEPEHRDRPPREIEELHEQSKTPVSESARCVGDNG